MNKFSIARLPHRPIWLAASVLLCVALFSTEARAQTDRDQTESRPVSEAKTLLGHREMAIQLDVAGPRIPESELKAILSRALSDAGIELLPPGSYPVLRLSVKNEAQLTYRTYSSRWGTSQHTYDVYLIAMKFEQLLAMPASGGTESLKASTWSQSSYGWAGLAATTSSLRDLTENLVANFVRDYRTVHGVLPTFVAPEPTIRETFRTIFYEFGEVPRDFHPPIPEVLPEGKFVQLEMEKSAPGALVSVRLTPGVSQGDVDVDAWERINRLRAQGDPRQYELYQEDRRSIALGDQRILTCVYRGATIQGRMTAQRYWYNTRPALADPARLRSRIPDHPMLGINEPQDSCPLTTADLP